MKRTSLIKGAALPLVLGILALGGLGLGGCKGSDPTAEDSDSMTAGEVADEVAEDAQDAADAVGEAAEETATDALEAVEDEIEDAEEMAEDAQDTAEGAAETVEEALTGGEDLSHPDGLNRFAPGGRIEDADLTKYWTSMDIAIDGQDVGTMTFELWGDAAPITVRNHLRLVDEGFYDGLTFHRIIRPFMVQGGDPLGNGMGNSPHGTIQAEFSNAAERSHEYGVLSMARTQMPNTASSQFFIISDNNGGKSLDGQYASFGRLTSGVDTLEAIANVRPTAPNGMRPEKKVVITSAEVHTGEAPKGEAIRRP